MPGADTTEELIKILDGIEGRRYAVVDAAHFDNLQDLLNEVGLPFHPLYLDEKDPSPDTEIAGPHLVELPTRGSARKLIALADGKPAIVWWVWPERGDGTTDEIYRHLRRLNVVEIPEENVAPDMPDEEEDSAGTLDAAGEKNGARDHGDHGPPPAGPQRYELVIFRHGDPSVMAMLLPLLDAALVSRLFGDANYIVVDQGNLASFPRPQFLPEKPRGWFRIERVEYRQIEELRLNWLSQRTGKYLRQYASNYITGMSNTDFHSNTKNWIIEAKKFGVTEESAFRKWCFLQAISKGRIHSNPVFRRHFTGNQLSLPANERVHDMTREIIEQLEMS
ncbi:protein of unknown function (DUF4123) [Hoeflea sp. IMCC20628]|nr:protein of unknown function (DUF4123) [Hoeflea sp. IMCC20628]